MKTYALLFSMLLLAPCIARGQGYEVCGPLANAYGPYDYRTAQDKLKIVDGAHFTTDVETLRRGNAGYLGGDLDYTLRASPNHHRALRSIALYAEIHKTDHIPKARYSVECYFNRAIRFAPDDATVHMLYGSYLFKTGAKQKALEEYKVAESLSEDNANLHYNLGLVYCDAKEYDKALEHAWKAYALGFQLPGLKNKLVAAGKWRDPPDQAGAGTGEPQKPR
ncbi:MAG TPA: tetratricopeptide repeat protein [Acidobacteriaceae bacterium]|nr:tetratricopeptide repeat protein [Acidobacteriaceae bacterium]